MNGDLGARARRLTPQRLLPEHAVAAETHRVVLQWFAALGGAFAWFLALNGQYGLVEVACGTGSTWPLHLVGLAGLGVTAAAFVVSLRLWRHAGRGWPGDAGDPLVRTKFLAVIGLLANPLFALIIVGQWIGTAFLHPCMAV